MHPKRTKTTTKELLQRLAKHRFFWYHRSGVARREEGEEPKFDSTQDPQADVRRNVYYWLRYQIVQTRIRSFYEMRIILENISNDHYHNHRRHLRLCPGAARRLSLSSLGCEESSNPGGVVAENVRPGVVNTRPTPL